MRLPLLAKRPPSCLLRTLFCPTHSTPHLSYILLRIWQPIQGLVITCGFSGYPEKLRGCLCDESSSGEVWFSWWKHRIFGGNPLWRLSVLLVFMTVLPDFELHCSPLTQLSVSLGISPAYSPCICSPTPIMTYRALPSHPPQKLQSPTVVPFFFFPFCTLISLCCYLCLTVFCFGFSTLPLGKISTLIPLTSSSSDSMPYKWHKEGEKIQTLWMSFTLNL